MGFHNTIRRALINSEWKSHNAISLGFVIGSRCCAWIIVNFPAFKIGCLYVLRALISSFDLLQPLSLANVFTIMPFSLTTLNRKPHRHIQAKTVTACCNTRFLNPYFFTDLEGYTSQMNTALTIFAKSFHSFVFLSTPFQTAVGTITDNPKK